MRQFTVRIREDAFDALLDLAVRERRAPREQASLLLERAALAALRLAASEEGRPPVPLTRPSGPLPVLAGAGAE